jgi:hypothetical protein
VIEQERSERAIPVLNIRESIVHRDELFGAPVNLDFRFHAVPAFLRNSCCV